MTEQNEIGIQKSTYDSTRKTPENTSNVPILIKTEERFMKEIATINLKIKQINELQNNPIFQEGMNISAAPEAPKKSPTSTTYKIRVINKQGAINSRSQEKCKSSKVIVGKPLDYTSDEIRRKHALTRFNRKLYSNVPESILQMGRNSQRESKSTERNKYTPLGNTSKANISSLEVNQNRGSRGTVEGSGSQISDISGICHSLSIPLLNTTKVHGRRQAKAKANINSNNNPKDYINWKQIKEFKQQKYLPKVNKERIVILSQLINEDKWRRQMINKQNPMQDSEVVNSSRKLEGEGRNKIERSSSVASIENEEFQRENMANQALYLQNLGIRPSFRKLLQIPPKPIVLLSSETQPKNTKNMIKSEEETLKLLVKSSGIMRDAADKIPDPMELNSKVAHSNHVEYADGISTKDINSQKEDLNILTSPLPNIKNPKQATKSIVVEENLVNKKVKIIMEEAKKRDPMSEKSRIENSTKLKKKYEKTKKDLLRGLKLKNPVNKQAEDGEQKIKKGDDFLNEFMEKGKKKMEGIYKSLVKTASAKAKNDFLSFVEKNYGIINTERLEQDIEEELENDYTKKINITVFDRSNDPRQKRSLKSLPRQRNTYWEVGDNGLTQISASATKKVLNRDISPLDYRQRVKNYGKWYLRPGDFNRKVNKMES